MSDVVTDYRRIREVLDEKWSLGHKVRLALEIVPVYVRARWLIARRDLPNVLATLRAAERASTLSELDAQLVGIRLGRAVERTLGPLPADSRCLIKSLVLVRLLARRGIQATFVIGVRWAPDFQAHAWLERAGIALLSDGGGEYERLTEL